MIRRLIAALPVSLLLAIGSCTACAGLVGGSQMDSVAVDVQRIDLDGFTRYQSFDEFTMKGVGEAADTPFVYVRHRPDTIMVVVSNDESRAINYVHTDRYWFNCETLDAYKAAADYRHRKDGSRPARTYYRFLMGDTILEYLRQFQASRLISHEIFVKTRHDCTHIELDRDYDTIDTVSPYDDVRQVVVCMSSRIDLNTVDHNVNIEDDGRLYFTRYIANDTLTWLARTIKQQIYYRYALDALGEYKYRLGIDEGTRWPDLIKNITEPTTDGWFFQQYLDDPISFPEGQAHFKQEVASILPNVEFDKPCAILVYINEKGKIYATQPAVTRGEPYDALMDQVVRQLPPFNPPMRNGKPVKSRAVITINFSTKDADYR